MAPTSLAPAVPGRRLAAPEPAAPTSAADADAAHAMARRGRAAVLEKYHWEATVQGLVAMYEGLKRET